MIPSILQKLFQGDDGEFPVMVADGVTMDMAVSGKQAFNEFA